MKLTCCSKLVEVSAGSGTVERPCHDGLPKAHQNTIRFTTNHLEYRKVDRFAMRYTSAAGAKWFSESPDIILVLQLNRRERESDGERCVLP